MAQIKDFVVKQGLRAEGTERSLSTTTGALTVGGGAGLGGNLNVGGSIKRFGNVDQGRDHALGAQLSLRDGTFTDELVTGRTAWGVVNYFGSSILDTITEGATYTNAASLFIKGAPTAGANLTIKKHGQYTLLLVLSILVKHKVILQLLLVRHYRLPAALVLITEWLATAVASYTEHLILMIVRLLLKLPKT
jgi:hypothetical protein